MKYRFDLYLPKFIISLILSTMAIFVIVAIFAPYFDTNKVLNSFFIMPNIGIDLVGGILPLLMALICTAVYFQRKLPKLTYVLCLSILFLIDYFTSRPERTGLINNPYYFALGASFIIVFFLTPYYIKLNKKSFWQLREIYIISLLLGVSCIPLSMIIVDLNYLPIFVKPVIGGNGLADAVFLSTMYSPLTITFLFSIYALLLPPVSIIKASVIATRQKS